jgi:fatty acid synthase
MPVFINANPQPQLSTPQNEVVISGIAGYFPESENVYQLQDKLFNKVNMVKKDSQRWKCGL